MRRYLHVVVGTAVLWLIMIGVPSSRLQAQCPGELPCENFSQYYCFIECNYCAGPSFQGFCYGGKCYFGSVFRHARLDQFESGGTCFECVSGNSSECLFD